MLSTNYVPGAPAWVDLTVPDVAAAAAFYEDVFDWESRETGPKGGGYLSCIIEGRTVAAIGPLTERGVTPAWTLHFCTTDADATAKAVEQAGETVRRAPLEFFDGGRVAKVHPPVARSSPSGSLVTSKTWVQWPLRTCYAGASYTPRTWRRQKLSTSRCSNLHDR